MLAVSPHPLNQLSAHDVIAYAYAAQLNSTPYSHERSQSAGNDRPIFCQGGGWRWSCSALDLAHVRDARHWKYAIWLHVASVHVLGGNGLEFSLAQLFRRCGILLFRADLVDRFSSTT